MSLSVVELNSLMDAYKATMPAKVRIPRELWQATAERIIRETIAECAGRERAYMLRLMLIKTPFFRDEPDFKALWYREQRRQLGQPEELSDEEDEIVDDTECRPTLTTDNRQPTTPPFAVRVIKPVPSLDDWPGFVQELLQRVLAEFPAWRSTGEEMGFEQTNWQIMRVTQQLRGELPIQIVEDQDPPAEWAEEPETWPAIHQIMRDVWFEECSKAFGFQTLKPIKRERQKSLF